MAYIKRKLRTSAEVVLQTAKFYEKYYCEKFVYDLRRDREKDRTVILNLFYKWLQVVLVSGLDMESGFSRELFLEWCTDVKNTVIVTGKELSLLDEVNFLFSSLLAFYSSRNFGIFPSNLSCFLSSYFSGGLAGGYVLSML